MIKAEVVFIGDEMIVNGWFVNAIGDAWEVSKPKESKQFTWLTDAIKYCMGN